MKTENILIGLAVGFVGYKILKSKSEQSKVGAIIEDFERQPQTLNQITATVQSRVDQVKTQFKHFKKYKTFGSAVVLNSEVEVLHYWTQRLKEANNLK